jgi:hypothetical protein
MRQIFKNAAIIAILSLLLNACSTTKAVRRMDHDIKGTWVLQTIITEGTSAKPKEKVFNEADFSCFIGSEWKFWKKYTGIYSIVDPQKICPEVKRWISWSFNENTYSPASFTFNWSADKKTGIGSGPKYNLTVLELSSTSMKLKQGIIIDGQIAAFIFNFVKH